MRRDAKRTEHNFAKCRHDRLLHEPENEDVAKK